MTKIKRLRVWVRAHPLKAAVILAAAEFVIFLIILGIFIWAMLT